MFQGHPIASPREPKETSVIAGPRTCDYGENVDWAAHRVDEAQAMGSDAECPRAHVERLKQMLVEQATHHERLGQELQARDWERWQLLQLLHQKDEQLSWHEGDARRQRTVLTVARDIARYYLVYSVLHVWRDHVHRLAASRLLSSVKSRLVSMQLRHSCAMIRTSLRHAVGRQLGYAMRELWLNSASWELSHHPTRTELDSLSDAKATDVLLLDSAFGALTPNAQEIKLPPPAGSRAVDVLSASPLRDTGSTPCTQSVHGSSHISLPARAGYHGNPKGDPTPIMGTPEDQLLYITPRRDSRELRRRCASPPSEASTCAPSSLSRHSGLGCLATSRTTIAGARLAIALGIASWRRLLWAVSRWHATAQARPAVERLSEAAAKEFEIQTATAEELQQRCGALEHHVGRTVRAESALCAKLVDAQVRAEALEQASCCTEHRFAENLNNELRSGEKLRLEAKLSQEAHARCEHEAEQTASRRAEVERLLGSVESSCEELESRLAQKLRWRGEAEEKIREMVACGENLEHERARLRRQLAEARQQRRSSSEQLQALRQSVESEEQLAEILRARVAVLEEDNSELVASLQLEQRRRLEDAAQHSAELDATQRAKDKLHMALQSERRSKEAVEHQAVEKTRRELLVAWGNERTQWNRAHRELERDLANAATELEASQQAEASEARAVVGAWDDARSALRLEWRSEGSTLREAVRAEFVGESELCKEMVAQLEHRLGQARQLHEGLESSRAAAEAAIAAPVGTTPSQHHLPPRYDVPRALWAAPPPSPHIGGGTAVSTPQSGPETPRLHELDAYADLVERLQVEVCREREERKASVQSLEALRGSYRLLLQRVSAGGNGECIASSVASSRLACGS